MLNCHAIIFSCNFSSTSRLGGGYRIATFLRKNGWDAEVIDYVMYWSLAELKDLVKSRINENTKFVGFATLWSMWNDHVNSLLTWIKDTYPDVITVISGSDLLFEFKNVY